MQLILVSSDGGGSMIVRYMEKNSADLSMSDSDSEELDEVYEMYMNKE